MTTFSSANVSAALPINRSRARSGRLISIVDIKVFASVLIVLLAIVLLSAESVGVPFHSSLPRVSHPSIVLGASRKDAIVISVHRSGEVWFGNERVSTPLIPAKIRERLAKGNVANRVYVEADARSNYRLVSGVLAAIRESGVDNVSFLVSPWSGLPR
jgi:biopolymer transport protein ExbD